MTTKIRPRHRSSPTTLVPPVHEWRPDLPFAAADARVFLTVAEMGSFASAASRHAMSPSSVSKCIRRLEDALGARLITRTTRSLHLTDEGVRFQELASRAFGLLFEAASELGAEGRAVKGLVRMGMPPLFGTYLMPRVLADLRAEHPGLAFEIVSTMRVHDLVDRGLDLVIAVGPLPNSSFVTRPLGWGQFVTVAAPEYVKRHPAPKQPADLKRHHCLGWTAPDGRVAPWTYEAGPVAVEASLRSDEMHHLAAMASAGLGIAQLPLFVVAEAIAAGRLVRLLPRAEPSPKLASIVLPARALSPRVRVVVDHLATRATPMPGTTRRRNLKPA